ncbi:uncharacterized protein LOC114536761 [Dendronephthya gigantea]|uniref:uncharacterized protein LOC114536761 n=1 Tax=Dendronephthya gigantea TaxID=151771 RepID=UPI001069389D|nr:uncharacterized protein LOC114536761 [Dendronephthya gigantea]
MLSDTMKSLSQGRKEQLHAKIQALDMSAFPATIRGNITRNYGSYVGRDFKLWMQVAVFILEDIIPHEQLFVWELLSEIFALAYSSGFDKRNSEGAKQLFKTFIDAVTRIYPEFLKKAKLHLLLHLVDDIENLGPANGFSTERFEAFNHFIRGLNVNSNRHASSLDICTKFAKLEKLRFVLSGGKWGKHNE